MGSRMATDALSAWNMSAGSTKQGNTVWDQHFMDIDRKVKSGTYTLFHYLLDGNSPLGVHQVTITEQGSRQLVPRVTRDRSAIPLTFVYDLNNRVSREFTFDFSTDQKVGIMISHFNQDEGGRGEVVYTNKTGNAAQNQLRVHPHGDFYWEETWGGHRFRWE